MAVAEKLKSCFRKKKVAINHLHPSLVECIWACFVSDFASKLSWCVDEVYVRRLTRRFACLFFLSNGRHYLVDNLRRFGLPTLLCPWSAYVCMHRPTTSAHGIGWSYSSVCSLELFFCGFWDTFMSGPCSFFASPVFLLLQELTREGTLCVVYVGTPAVSWSCGVRCALRVARSGCRSFDTAVDVSKTILAEIGVPSCVGRFLLYSLFFQLSKSHGKCPLTHQKDSVQATFLGKVT